MFARRDWLVRQDCFFLSCLCRGKRLAVEGECRQYCRSILPGEVPVIVQNNESLVIDYVRVLDEALETDPVLFKVVTILLRPCILLCRSAAVSLLRGRRSSAEALLEAETHGKVPLATILKN
jgi:hypothetical protein